MKFRSGYSMRIYEELLRVKGMSNVIKHGHILTIYELRFLLGLDRDKMYLKYDNFRQRVLLPAQKEIKEKEKKFMEFHIATKYHNFLIGCKNPYYNIHRW
jgi:hypothetical protein